MVYTFFKRSLDIVGAVFGIIIFSPILVLTSIAIKMTSDGPVLVEVSTRVGQDGKIFRMYKFRSMIKDAHDLIRKDPVFKKIFDEYKKNSFKLKNDPRITPLGRFLRKTSIDELPQLFNVLKGEMSLVGPRAFYPDELEVQKKEFPVCKDLIGEALLVKPGITGLWQVSGRSKIGFDKRIEMDAKYAKSKSISMDLFILLKTPLVVIKGEGVH